MVIKMRSGSSGVIYRNSICSTCPRMPLPTNLGWSMEGFEEKEAFILEGINKGKQIEQLQKDMLSVVDFHRCPRNLEKFVLVTS